ncbi:hypothetical protein AJ80_04992 [Polytolypa hystricis UAMH7299]|uniref:SPRY domain-containing protein n=1 Tax=Polytolypa hystricis (strain UAMH7299) TaxID=1447883 RepID=A0A2B7XYQ1_POLH7|nr:hypothetical protein AJ80_04992 [Polytolypa hystricis UAMH7299]
MPLYCCGSKSDEDAHPIPNRPVEISKDSKYQSKKPAVPSKSPLEHQHQHQHQPFHTNPADLSTAEEKRRVFDPDTTGASFSGPSTGIMSDRTWAPPPGPPPSHQPNPAATHSYAPPPGPPPGYQNQLPLDNPPPYHNWEEAVPDTALFPPPPVGGYLDSNTGNASTEDADLAHNFCDNNPLWNPCKPSPAVYDCVQSSDIRPVKPPRYTGELDVVGRGRWKGRTGDYNKDCLLLTGLPIYFAAEDSPLLTERTKIVYFEVKFVGQHGGREDDESGFSIGFAAQPYPSFRSPGWERGSVGVFSDDGCRFVNDTWGGREFTTRFKIGETIGLGMKFSLPDEEELQKFQVPGQSPRLAVEIFLTRNGEQTGSWDLHEEVDEEAGDVEGLEGNFDLYGALGLFGGVEFEVCFDPAGWKWMPPAV